MAELKFCRNEDPGEMPLLGKTCNKSNFARNCKPRGECSTIPAKYFEEKRQTVHKREQKYFYSLISPQNTLWRANQTNTKDAKLKEYTSYLTIFDHERLKNVAQCPSKDFLD